MNVNGYEITKILLLGDSITTGYGLSENELFYGDYLESYFDAETNNFAVNGLTTSGLIEKLDEQEIIDSIIQSDFICISIGGNDFLSIFFEALQTLNGGIPSPDNNINISSDFISKFVLDYSSAFGSAAVTASENIKIIKDRITELNPDAEIIMQTIYNPFEVSDIELNSVMTPLKTFASLYLTTINNTIKEVSPYTADIYLKFFEKPYLYTNIEKMDIHPNYIGHLLIAEEVIQTIGGNGNFSLLSDEIFNIPNGIFNEFPEYMSDELNLFAKETLRSGTLEQSLQASVSVTAQESETQKTEVTEDTAKTTVTEQQKKTKKSNNILSKILLIAGFTLILAVTMRRFIKERKKNK